MTEMSQGRKFLFQAHSDQGAGSISPAFLLLCCESPAFPDWLAWVQTGCDSCRLHIHTLLHPEQKSCSFQTIQSPELYLNWISYHGEKEGVILIDIGHLGPIAGMKVFPGDSRWPANAGDITDPGSIPGLGRSPGGYSNPLQYSCLKNPMERGAWQTMVYWVAKSWTRLMWLSAHTSTHTHTHTHTRNESGRSTLVRPHAY